jgi:hypothetical protein
MTNPADNLNHRDKEVRLCAIRALAESSGPVVRSPTGAEDVNNHIHTTYSFSPYSPSAAVWAARTAGLSSAGIMDHDTIAGAREFIEAGRLLGIPTTIGLECRVDFSDTGLAGRRINNPDQKGNVYVAIHGVPHTQIDTLQAFFAPRIEGRNRRNRAMVQRINAVVAPHGLAIDFDTDVIPLSQYHDGGVVTERHLLFALALRLIEQCGRGAALAGFLENALGITLGETARTRLRDTQSDYYPYDFLGVLKAELVPRFYVDADEECPHVREIVALTRRVGAILAYAYLGDVGESVTADKRPQCFEDSYLEEVFDEIRALGFQAVTYMPSRNTGEQLTRVQSLCRQHGLLEISGEDINSPRQSFVCGKMREPQFRHLVDSTWALIGHEQESIRDIENGFFGTRALARCPSIADRITAFGQRGRRGR